jgi:hypothetical protein
MNYKILTVMLLILMTAVVAFAQTSYKGLIPGKSRKVEVVRVLGQPVKQLSETLVEYRPQPLSGRIYVQYRQDSAVVERIEFICRLPDSTCADFVASLNIRLPEGASEVRQQYEKGKYVIYHASPHFVAETYDGADTTRISARVAFYSRELYEAEVAKAKEANQTESGTTEEAPTQGGIAPIGGATTASISRGSGKNAPALSGSYGEVTGIVKLRAADGSLQPAANATVEFYRTDVPNRTQTKTDRKGIFQYVGLSQAGNWVVVVSGPGLKWAHLDGVRTPVGGLEIIVEPGDGSVPTSRDVQNAIKKN